jgi:hypothetical protein
MTRRQARENTGMAAEAVAACTTALETVKALVETNKARLAEIDNERQQLTGAALIDCDPLAKQRLDALSAETVAVKAHLENTMAAILEGEVRLQNAQARQAAAQQVENAQSSRALLAERQRLSKEAQSHLDDFNRKFAQIIQLGRDLRSLNPRATSERHDGLILRASMTNARVALARLGLLSVEPMPQEQMRVALPSMVEHLDKLAAAWCNSVTYNDDSKGPVA